MCWVDQIFRAGKLHIGDLRALSQTGLVVHVGITHMLSAFNQDINATHVRRLQHMHIEADPPD